jgi:amino acid adenylation domain-containing protein
MHRYLCHAADILEPRNLPCQEGLIDMSASLIVWRIQDVLHLYKWQMNSWLSADSAIPLDFGGPVDVDFDPFGDLWAGRPIVERFEKIALQHPSRPAVVDSARRLTYSELRSWAYSVARRIDALAAPGRPVGILLPHNACFPVAALACLAADRPYVPIDLKYPAARIDAIIREAGLDTVILQGASDAARLLPAGITQVDIGSAPEAAVEPVAGAASAESLAVILYTSGSTGKPKGICNDQRAILQRVAEYTNSCHVHPEDRFILLSSPGTIAGEREMFTALLNGAALHVTDPQLDGIHSVLNTMEEHRITIGYAVPSLLRMLLRLPGAAQAFSHFRVIRVGGDITLASDLALFREIAPPACRFFASFSSTETPAVFQWFVPSDWQTTGARVPIGYPRPGIDFAVLDEDGQPAPAGEVGELVVRSRYLAVGQWQDGRLTAGPFMNDPGDSSIRILRTGDMVKRRADGLWELFGRKDRQIKIRGQRIDAGEVEAALRSCDGVMDVAVIARRSGEEVTALAAFVAPRKDGLPAELKRALIARVPQYMHPADIRLIDAIPQLPGFKPDMAALETLDRQQLERAASTGRNESKAALDRASPVNGRIRDAVRHAWTIVLGAKSYEADLPWNETNGDSLKAIELWFYIEDKLGFKLPLDVLDEDTTPGDLIATIEKHLAQAGGNRDKEDSRIPVVFLLPGIQSDDPALARFRAAFGKDVRFKLIDYPGWRHMVAAGAGFDAIVDAVFAKICAEPACDVYRIAGYSYGGIVAFEVARRLASSGRHVGFLGLLDTRRWDMTPQHQLNSFHTFLDESPSLRLDWIKGAIAMLIRRRRFGLLGRMERLLMLRPTKLAFWFKRRLTRELRYQAFRQWKPAPLAVPTVLFLSADRWPGEPDNYGWDGACNSLTKVYIGGTHATIIQSPQREALCRSFLQALEDGSGTGFMPVGAGADNGKPRAIVNESPSSAIPGMAVADSSG